MQCFDAIMLREVKLNVDKVDGWHVREFSSGYKAMLSTSGFSVHVHVSSLICCILQQ